MRFGLVSLVFLAPALGSVLDRRGCYADDCARAVTGTGNEEPDVPSRRADCSSLMATTVTPEVM